jgi:hypothetical protein
MENNIDVIYPEIGYFQLGSIIDNLIIHKKTTKGSRMSCIYPSRNAHILRDECARMIHAHIPHTALFIFVNK